MADNNTYSEVEKNAINDFEFIVSSFIMPLLPAATEWTRERNSSTAISNNLIYEKDGYFLIYPSFASPILIKVENIGEPNYPIKAAKQILEEIMKVSQYYFENDFWKERSCYNSTLAGSDIYKLKRYELAYEIGLCKWLGNISVYGLLDRLKNWTMRTYEGKRVPFGFIIDVTNKAEGNSTHSYIEFLDSNHSAAFSNGVSSAISLDGSGKVVDYFTTEKKNDDKNEVVYSPSSLRQLKDMILSIPKGVDNNANEEVESKSEYS